MPHAHFRLGKMRELDVCHRVRPARKRRSSQGAESEVKHRKINVMGSMAGKSAPGLIGMLIAAVFLLAIGAASVTYLLQLRLLRTNAAGACDMAIYNTTGSLDFYTRMADMSATMAVDYYFGYSRRMHQNLYGLYPALESISVYEIRNNHADRILLDGAPLLPHEQEMLEKALPDPSLQSRYLVTGMGGKNSLFILSKYSKDESKGRDAMGFVALKVNMCKIIEESGSLANSQLVEGYEMFWRSSGGDEKLIASDMDGARQEPDVEVSHRVDDSLSGTGHNGTVIIRASSNHSSISSFEQMVAFGCTILMMVIFGTMYSYTARLRHTRDSLERISLTDGLTGLYNRPGGDRAVAALLARGAKRISVLAMDLDEFKRLNDVYGHALGDEALKQIAQDLRQAFGDGAVIIRTGGDEFQVLLEDADDGKCEAVIEQFTSKDHSVEFQGQEVSFSVSIGLAQYPKDASTIKQVFSCADAALYNAKSNGRRSWSRYEPRMAVASRINLGFNFNDIAHGCPAGIVLYRDGQSGEILYANPFFVRMCSCSSFDDLAAFSEGSFEGLVAPSYRKDFLRGIAYQKGRAEYGMSGYSSFKLRVKDGSEKSAIGVWKVMESGYYGTLMYMLVVDSSELDARSLAVEFSQSMDLN